MPTSFTVANLAQLNAAIQSIDLGGASSAPNTAYTITFAAPSGTLSLTGDLNAINLASNDTLTIVGAGEALDGGGTTRGLFVEAGTVAVNDLTIKNATATGGAGGDGFNGGGGGAGLGGGLFIGTAGTVTLGNVTFSNDVAQGGAGGNGGGGATGAGGGGMGGAGGGSSSSSGYAYGGGGGIGSGATGGLLVSGGTGIVSGALAGGKGASRDGKTTPGNGGTSGGGGGGGTGAGGGGGISGGNGSGLTSTGKGGTGGFGGGGGGAYQNGGGGGFGGGGGSGYNAGAGGFGGGGGGTNSYYTAKSGSGGVGAGHGGYFFAGSGGGGGGGLGAGGDIFVQQGGALILQSGSLSGGNANGGAAGSGGSGATAGKNAGGGVFMQGTETIALAPGAGQILTIADVISDQSGSLPAGVGTGKLDVEGPGTVVLSAGNTYVGDNMLNGGTLELVTKTSAGSGAIIFGGTAELRLDSAVLTNLVENFAVGDVIDLAAIAPADVKVTQTGTITSISGVQLLGTYDVGGPSGLLFAPDAGTGTLVTLACFAAGTHIATANGDVPVEHLSVGDKVCARFGGLVPVIWLGHRSVDCRHHPKPTQLWPVRVRAGAFGEGIPRSDLYLSPDHSVYVDGNLMPIRYLVNGVSIVQQAVDTLTYWHVELPAHDVLLADGLPAESFLDTGTSKADFANGGPAVTLHPDFSSLKWEASGCAPLIVSGPTLAAVRQRLEGRARLLFRRTVKRERTSPKRLVA